MLDNAHWQFEGHTQRVTTKQWKAILLEERDQLIFHGRLRQLKARNMGAGVYEIYKKPLKD